MLIFRLKQVLMPQNCLNELFFWWLVTFNEKCQIKKGNTSTIKTNRLSSEYSLLWNILPLFITVSICTVMILFFPSEPLCLTISHVLSFFCSWSLSIYLSFTLSDSYKYECVHGRNPNVTCWPPIRTELKMCIRDAEVAREPVKKFFHRQQNFCSFTTFLGRWEPLSFFFVCRAKTNGHALWLSY